jgi:chorismate-pyruvate lyase
MPDQMSSLPGATALPFVHPLDDFYARAGLRLPKIERIGADEIPEPYRALLVHENDMTPTLEKYHGAEIHLRILGHDQREDFYFREVVLQLNESDRPVEFGANKINLALFPPRARQLILAERLPLGTILRMCETAHSTRPKAFFRTDADELISGVLNMAKPAVLYGRRATILDPEKRPLSEIVEILPPDKGQSDRKWNNSKTTSNIE